MKILCFFRVTDFCEIYCVCGAPECACMLKREISESETDRQTEKCVYVFQEHSVRTRPGRRQTDRQTGRQTDR